MNNDDQNDPLQGKGEEMLPESGNPFDDAEEETSTPAEEPDSVEDATECWPRCRCTGSANLKR